MIRDRLQDAHRTLSRLHDHDLLAADIVLMLMTVADEHVAVAAVLLVAGDHAVLLVAAGRAAAKQDID